MNYHSTAEEEYFYRLNRELIEKNKLKWIAEKQQQEQLTMKKLHWMKCPKCGHNLKETDISGIKIDKCNTCSGIYFDNSELELLLENQKPEGFLLRLCKALVKEL